MSWLRGYCHFLAAWGELLLAVDGQEVFNSAGHLFFLNPESPYGFLREASAADNSDQSFSRPLISDVVAYIHLMLRLRIAEPQRLRRRTADGGSVEAGVDG
ncbi:MAG: hypothetical protein HY000_37280 [Planctomycetes bacterium]|nr:hypothetical protein [Planctomycetota bacterium]